MLNKVFYKSNNILNNLIIDSDMNDIFESIKVSDLIQVYSVDGNEYEYPYYKLSYNNKYPNIFTIDVDIPSNVNLIEYTIGAQKINIAPNTSTIFSVKFYDEYMKLCCDTLCTNDNKQKLNDFNIELYGQAVGAPTSQVVFIYDHKNPLTGNIIYDYVKSSTGNISYGTAKFEPIIKKEIIGYALDTNMPHYTFKCVDSTGGITYHKIKLVNLNYTSSVGIITSEYYDIEFTVDSTIDDNTQTIATTLPILLKSTEFHKYFSSLRDEYISVDLLLKITNWDNSVYFSIYENMLWFSQTRGCQFNFILDYNNIDLMVDYGHQFLNRGLYFRLNTEGLSNVVLTYTKTNFTSFYNEDTNNILYKINNMDMSIIDPTIDKSLLVSNNYQSTGSENIYYKLELYKPSYIVNRLTITLRDLVDSHIWDIAKEDHVSTVMDQISNINQYGPTYNPENTFIKIDDFCYSTTDKPDIINNNIDLVHLAAQKFYSEKTNVVGVNISDVTSIMDNLDDNLQVNIFQRKISKLSSYIYIQFKDVSDLNYLKKFIMVDYINMVLDNIILSITKMELSTNNITLEMQKPLDTYINKYSDEDGVVTYMYAINGMEILNINGVFNKNIIEGNYADSVKDTTTYYVPNDIVLITNNKT